MNIFRAIEFIAAGRPFECAGTYASIVCPGWEKPTIEELTAASDAWDAAETQRLAQIAALNVKRQALADLVTPLRQWAADASSTVTDPAKWDVWTTAQRFAAMKIMLTRLGTAFDKLADMIETR